MLTVDMLSDSGTTAMTDMPAKNSVAYKKYFFFSSFDSIDSVLYPSFLPVKYKLKKPTFPSPHQ